MIPNFEQGQTKMTQRSQQGKVASYKEGKPFNTKFGECMNCMLTIDGAEYKLPFVKMDKSLPFKVGDTVCFMYEPEEYNGNVSQKIDSRTFKVIHDTNSQSYDDLPRPTGSSVQQAQRPQAQSAPSADKDVLFVNQVSLKTAGSVLEASGVTAESVIDMAKQLTDWAFSYKPNPVKQSGQSTAPQASPPDIEQWAGDEVPF